MPANTLCKSDWDEGAMYGCGNLLVWLKIYIGKLFPKEKW
jgi:hypothetical protein